MLLYKRDGELRLLSWGFLREGKDGPSKGSGVGLSIEAGQKFLRRSYSRNGGLEKVDHTRSFIIEAGDAFT